MNNHIFISYSSKDKKIAFQLVDYLESNDIKCWIAPRNIVSGHDYTDTIDDAIKHCDGIVLIFSDNSAKSIWVKKEITLGVSHQKNVIPFKITHTETDGGFNFMLNNLQWIDGTGHPAELFPEIVEGLKRYDASLANVKPTVVPHTNKKKYPIIIGAVCAIALGVTLPLTLSNKNVDAAVTDTVAQEVVAPVEQAVLAEPTAQAEPVVEKAKVSKTSSDEKTKKKETAKTESVWEKTEIKVEKADASAVKEPAPVVKEVAPVVKEPVKETKQPSPQEVKYSKAIRFYNAKRYSDALKMFEELKSSGFRDSYIDTYISNCKENIK